MTQQIDQLVGILRICGESLFYSLLCHRAPKYEGLYQRLSSPVVGDLVAETTTFWNHVRKVNTEKHGDAHINAVGWLLRIEQEPVHFGDPTFVWDEKEEGRPHPIEKVWYIKTLDDREFRWTNASFFVIPTDPELLL